MGLVELIILIAFLGVIVWGIFYVFPQMPDMFKRLIYVISVLIVLIILLQVFGVNLNLGAIHVGK